MEKRRKTHISCSLIFDDFESGSNSQITAEQQEDGENAFALVVNLIVSSLFSFKIMELVNLIRN